MASWLQAPQTRVAVTLSKWPNRGGSNARKPKKKEEADIKKTFEHRKINVIRNLFINFCQVLSLLDKI